MKNSIIAMLAAGMLSAGCTSFADGPCCACKGAAGRWAIQKPGAFWLGICNKDGKPSAKLLWGGGSPVDQYDISIDGANATMKQRMGKGRYRLTKVKASGCEAEVTFQNYNDKNEPQGKPEVVKAKRIPALPPAPDLAKLKFGETVDLLAGGIDGWESMNPKNHFGWSLKDGVLMNRIKRKANGKPDGSSANLKTKRADFMDFKLSYDVRVLPGCNSGVYLRGIYEIQVLDSYGKPVNCHNMAALYGRITPRVAAEKPANEWQHVDVTLYKRHLTVVLNGVNIIDNQPVLGCTGGAITSDEFVPGPIYLQGDHSDADFRNMKLTPILK